MTKTIRILELFAGTESFSEAGRDRGHETFTVEIDPGFNPDLVADITELSATDLHREFPDPDVIWASPPCKCFSVASIWRHWTSTNNPKTDRARRALEMIQHTIELIGILDPDYYFVENPVGMLRKTWPIIDWERTTATRRETVTYCQYGDTRMKPTDIWTNLPGWVGRRCRQGASCHEASPRGVYSGTQGMANSKARAVVPQDLCHELVKRIEKEPRGLFDYGEK